MHLHLPHEVIEQIKEKHEEIISYIQSKEMSLVSSARTKWPTYEDMPITFLKIIADLWQERINSFDAEQIESSRELSRELDSFNGLKEHVDELTTSKKAKPTSLIQLATRLKQILTLELSGKERPWLYKVNDKGEAQPYLVKNVRYRSRDSWEEASAIIDVISFSKTGITQSTWSIDSYEFKKFKRDPYIILKECLNVYFETEDLYQEYLNMEEDYLSKRRLQNVQLICSKGHKFISDNLHYIEAEIERDPLEKLKDESGLVKGNSELFPSEDGFQLPLENMIYLFSLTDHVHKWIRADSVELYQYDKTIVEKLVLPDDHKDLIDILLNDEFKSVGQDIIEGKGLGTTILTKGKPGLGKTVTAEIYSELKELPLYSVHSGQLGTNGELIEKKLREIMENAERWGCILLVDEADVYIRRRDNDVNHNAIVATFLRVLEYYKGILFMTTNREDDVDDAISSRCSAVLTYQLPEDDVAYRLWELYANNQFSLNMNKEELNELCEKLPKLSGRDIKNITQLTARFIKGKTDVKKATVKHFLTCATFRGLSPVTK